MRAWTDHTCVASRHQLRAPWGIRVNNGSHQWHNDRRESTECIANRLRSIAGETTHRAYTVRLNSTLSVGYGNTFVAVDHDGGPSTFSVSDSHSAISAPSEFAALAFPSAFHRSLSTRPIRQPEPAATSLVAIANGQAVLASNASAAQFTQAPQTRKK